MSVDNNVYPTKEDLGKKAIIDEKPFQQTDMKETWADISKAADILGWRPMVEVREGIRKSVNHYLDNQSVYQQIELP